MKQKNSNAFTIVEIIVVVTIIAILSSLAVITFNSVRKDSRDAARQSSATIISEALEKYYETNGEYPSVASLANNQPANTGDAIASKLSIPAGSLIMPKMPSTTTNGIVAGTNPQNDYLAYEGESAENNVACQGDVNGGCDKFALRYLEETSEAIKTIQSRRNSRSTSTSPEIAVSTASTTSINASWTAIPGTTSYTLQRSLSGDMSSPVTTAHTLLAATATGLTPNTEYFFRVRAILQSGSSGWSAVESATTSTVAAPTGIITVVAAMSVTNARGTAGGGTCASGSTIERQIRYQINIGSWQTWETISPKDVAATEGYEYTFQAQARCVVGTVGGPWIQSITASITRSVTVPSGLTISAAMSGTNAQGTAAGGSCGTGTTIERQIRYEATSTSTAGSWSTYTTGTPRNVAANQGWRYTFQQQARCVGTNASSSWATSSSDAVVRPITTTPAAPTVTNSTSGNITTWSWNATSGCPTGTTARYTFRSIADGGLTNSGWEGPYASYTSNAWWTELQGYEYTREVLTHCYTVHSTGPWSGTGSSAYLRPINTPGLLTDVRLQSMAADRSEAYITWTAPGCGAGTVGYANTQLYLYGGWNGWSGYGLHTRYRITASPGPIPPNFTVGVRGKYKCVNPNTLREGAEGSTSASTTFNI